MSLMERQVVRAHTPPPGIAQSNILEFTDLDKHEGAMGSRRVLHALNAKLGGEKI